MTCKSSCRMQESNPLDGENFERARIFAAFMGVLVEHSIKKLDFGQIAAGADVSLAQLREELGSTIAVLAAHAERIDRLILAGGDVATAERAQGLAMVLTAVLRTWLDGEDQDLACTMSALDRAGAWAAPRGLPRPRLWILSTGVAEDDHPTAEFRATERGRKGGLKGGKARAAALTPERRREIAQLAAQKRWRSPKRHP